MIPDQVACLALEGVPSSLLMAITPADAKKECGAFLSLRSCVATLLEKKELVAGWGALDCEVRFVHDILNAPTIPAQQLGESMATVMDEKSVMGKGPLVIALRRTAAGMLLLRRAEETLGSRQQEIAAVEALDPSRSLMVAARNAVRNEPCLPPP